MAMKVENAANNNEQLVQDIISCHDPILLIGSGGTGSKLVVNTDNKLKNMGHKTPRMVAAFDSDIEAADTPNIDEANTHFQISRGWTMEEHLTTGIENAKDAATKRSLIELEKRTPDVVKAKRDTEGAAQMPSLSALMLFNMLHNVSNDADNLFVSAENKFFTRLNDISKQRPKRLRIMIAGSPVGGTGSGTTAMLVLCIRHWLTNNNINGFIDVICMLPELFADKHSEAEKKAGRARAYAFFKEINYLNSPVKPGQLSQKFEFRPGECFEEQGFTSVIDNLILIDGSRDDGEKIASLEAGIEYCTDIALLHLHGTPGNKYLSKSDNVTRVRAQAETEQDSRKYSTCGLGILRYPVKHVQQYISLELIQQLFQSDWLYMDIEYRTELQEWLRKQAEGETQLAKPERGEHFIDMLHSIQRENPLFKPVYHSVMVKTVDEETGVEREENTVSTYHESLYNHLWNELQHNAHYQAFQQTIDVNVVEQLTQGYGLQQVTSNLNQSVNNLKNYFNKVLQSQPDTILSSIFKTAETARQDKPYYLQTYIKDKHPNAARFFLYQLQKLCVTAKQKAKTDNEARIEELERTEKTFEGGSAHSQLRELEKSAFSGILGKKKHFASELDKYSHKVRNAWQERFKAEIELKFYSYVLEQIEPILSYYEKLADGIFDTLLVELREKSQMLENTFEKGARQDDCVNYVGCKPTVLRGIRDSVLQHAAAQTGGNQAVFSNYNEFILQQHYRDRQTLRVQGSKTTSDNLLRQFRHNILDGELTDFVKQTYSHYYDFDIVQAIHTEANYLNFEPEEYTRLTMQTLAHASKPYIKLRNEEELENDFSLLMLTEEVSANLPDTNRLFRELNMSAVEVLPLPEFSQYELKLANFRMGLSLRNVKELSPKGRYFKAFSEVNEQVMKNLYTNDKKLAEQSVFIRPEWSVPGVLPEAFPEVREQHIRKSHMALMLGYIKEVVLWQVILFNRALTIMGNQVSNGSCWDEHASDLLRRPDLINALHELQSGIIATADFSLVCAPKLISQLLESEHYQLIVPMWFDLLLECCQQKTNTQLESVELALIKSDMADALVTYLAEEHYEAMRIKRIEAYFNQQRELWLQKLQIQLDTASQLGRLA